jgi:hypothetical protein
MKLNIVIRYRVELFVRGWWLRGVIVFVFNVVSICVLRVNQWFLNAKLAV